jgi:monoamine oxidase
MYVNIIGAGAAGLAAGYLLKNHNIPFKIFEASNRYGGRILHLENFADFPVECGAEQIHGQKSILFEMAEHFNREVLEDDGRSTYFLGGFLKSEEELLEDKDYQLLEEIWEELYEARTIHTNLEAWALSKGLSPRWIPVLNGWIANPYGASAELLNMNALAGVGRLWSAGNKNYVFKKGSYLSLLTEAFSNVFEHIQYNTLIEEVDYSRKYEIKLKDFQGNLYYADKVIVTVPLPVLQRNMIHFIPALPVVKQHAIKNLKMGKGMKILLKFRTCFWDPTMLSLYTDGYIPEYWVTSLDRSNDYVLTGFVNGKNARYLSRLSEDSVIRLILDELDFAYGDHKASEFIEDYCIVDWSKKDYIWGTYSYPAEENDNFHRQQLSLPVDQKIFFAGEATHFEGHFATVHGALETANRAVEQIVNPKILLEKNR